MENGVVVVVGEVQSDFGHKPNLSQNGIIKLCV